MQIPEGSPWSAAPLPLCLCCHLALLFSARSLYSLLLQWGSSLHTLTLQVATLEMSFWVVFSPVQVNMPQCIDLMHLLEDYTKGCKVNFRLLQTFVPKVIFSKRQLDYLVVFPAESVFEVVSIDLHWWFMDNKGPPKLVSFQKPVLPLFLGDTIISHHFSMKSIAFWLWFVFVF